MGVENLDVASPDMSDQMDDQSVTDTPIDDAGAEPSPAADDGAPSSLLDVVRNAVKEQPDDNPDSPAGDNSEPTEEDRTIASDPVEPDDEDYSDAPFHNHPRFKQLIAQRNEFRQGHAEYGKVMSYLQDNGLSAEDAAQGLRIQALLKADPNEAWAVLKPIVQDLLTKTGEYLPADLQEQVRKGALTRDMALEVSRARALQTTSVAQREQEAQRAEERRQREHVKTLSDAASSWEQSKMRGPGADPDFAAKAQDLEGEILRLQRLQGMPRDASGVRKMLDEAHANVSRRRAPAPRQATSPITNGRGTAPQSTAPQSVLDIVKRGGAPA